MGNLTQIISRSVADSRKPGSLAAKARSARFAKLLATFPELRDMRVLDLGGRGQFWELAQVRPSSVTTVNLYPTVSTLDWWTNVEADACTLDPSTLGEFDLVFSNSLLEHLGGHYRRDQLASVVRAAADRYWIQTPYRYFPVEPHWVFPGLQFLPFEARVQITKKWPIGHCVADGDRDDALAFVSDVELIGKTQMRIHFPDSEIWMERWKGMPKSMVAIKRG
jgi:hypothetical protein